MNANEAKRLFLEIENINNASAPLIEFIDILTDEVDRKMLRRAYGELIATIEEKFVYDLCRKYPEFSALKPGWTE